MSRKNVASGNDRVAVQIGVINPRPAASGKPQSKENVRVENIREGNARVGMQIDHIDGDVWFF